MARLGPVDHDPSPDPLDYLNGDDRAWLDRMSDVLPPSMPVAGSSSWAHGRHDSWITTETVRW